MPRRKLSLDECYEVDPNTGCWIWRCARWRSGYGRVVVDREDGGRRTIAAHRVVYEKHRGPIPDGLQLDHLCQVKSCVNPDHLEPVTAQENKFRDLDYPRRNLTDKQVSEIRIFCLSFSHAELAERYGISEEDVSRLIRRARHTRVII